MLEKVLRVSKLMDIYGGLLTEKHRKICGFYYTDNYSLGEIAELEGISRQAVHESLERSVAIMERTESAMGLLTRTDRLLEMLDEIRVLIESLKPVDGDSEIINEVLVKVAKLSEDVLFGGNG